MKTDLCEALPSVSVLGGGPGGTHFLNACDLHPGLKPMKIEIFDPAVNATGGTVHADASSCLRVNMVEERHDFEGRTPFRDYKKQFGGDDSPALRADLGNYTNYVRQEVVRNLTEKGFSIRFVRQPGVAMTRKHSQSGCTYTVTLQNGHTSISRYVVLATGHHPPALPSTVDLVDGTTDRISYYDGTTRFKGRISASDRVLGLGTGPSGGDVARVGREEIGLESPIYLASRTGRLSAVQCITQPSDALLGDMEALLKAFEQPERLTLRQLGKGLQSLFKQHAPDFDFAAASVQPKNALLHLVQCIDEAQRSDPARQVLEVIGRAAPEIWRRLTDEALIEFLDKHKRVYMANRHAMPLQTARWLASQLSLGTIEVAKVIDRIKVSSEGIFATLDLLPGGKQLMEFDRLVIATGPEYRLTKSNNPLIKQLISSRMALPGSMGDTEVGGFATVNFEVKGLPGVFAMGALSHCEDFAVTSFPALARHAKGIVATIAERTPRQALPATTDLTEPLVASIAA